MIQSIRLMMADKKYLIFTDLDGSLLDHFDYSFEAANDTLQALRQAHIPVICCTSKTSAELIALREVLANEHPFIVENGAAVYIPEGYFTRPLHPGSASHRMQEGYDRYAFVRGRHHWQQLIAEQRPHFGEQFTTFQQLGTEGIAESTGLDIGAATLANLREFGEPVLWTGDETDRQKFIESLSCAGAKVLQGGRFMHISGECDKGSALNWLVAAYQEEYGGPVTSIAAGDSDNDVAMLEAADRSIIIRSPVHEPPAIDRTDDIFITVEEGPAGWAEGINRIIFQE